VEDDNAALGRDRLGAHTRPAAASRHSATGVHVAAPSPGTALPDLPNSKEREELRRVRKENYELRRANEILKSASVFFAKELDQNRTR
jgi:transposase